MAGDVRATTIDSLGLEVEEAFAYRFDFGDNWMRQIRVEAIEASPGKGKYPKVVEREGKSPPQYPDEEDD